MNGIPGSQMSEFAPDVIALIGTGAAKVIPLANGKVAVVDAEDYDRIVKFTWSSIKHRYTFYATGHVWINGKRTTSRLHREILRLSVGSGEIVDHRNRNGLDCRKTNLRLVSNEINSHNRRKNRNNTSGYRGVSWNKGCRKWIVHIRSGVHCGCFDNKEEAAMMYDKKVLEIYGESAILNFPRGGEVHGER